ncbi:DNA-binding transcriptional regulator, MarR family [Pedococcus dokdonensis]|uniref:DNA-binding transcriptional regulator, MarR family n=1 Tax=Pedococcus dokdonensis TaxID=443156 RepID=A0A1H0KL29_9MICO|nr:MarR family transcriptional regulator [Pedococcus dokdonensis]SDO56452.1 DNA-binding transcriptional regulator, MarR family [Pedococcus dokdonensis]
MAEPQRDQDEDWVDQHVQRWRRTFDGFDPEVEGAIVRVGAINRHVKRMNTAAFGALGVGPSEYDTLHTLLVQPEPIETTPAQLAEACHVTRAAMTSRLDRLVELGHVTRDSDPLDRRRIIVRPTRSGREVWKKALELALVQEKQTINVLSDTEKTQLNTLLRKIVLGLDG